MYKISYSKEARKILQAMQRPFALIILKKIEILALNPYEKNNNVKALKGGGFRLRVGDWRVLYTVKDNQLEIYVVTIGSRGGVYS